jgi:hypothetical protein
VIKVSVKKLTEDPFKNSYGFIYSSEIHHKIITELLTKKKNPKKLGSLWILPERSSGAPRVWPQRRPSPAGEGRGEARSGVVPPGDEEAALSHA